MERGLNVLLTGSNAAFKNYRLILTRAESQESRKLAGTNVLRLVRDVHAAASLLEAKPESVADCISLTCSGLRVMNEPELQQAFMQLVDSDANAVRENSACAELLERSPAS